MIYTVTIDNDFDILCEVEPFFDTSDGGFDDFDIAPIISDDMSIFDAATLIEQVVNWKALLLGEEFDSVIDELTELARLEYIDGQIAKAELLEQSQCG